MSKDGSTDRLEYLHTASLASEIANATGYSSDDLPDDINTDDPVALVEGFYATIIKQEEFFHSETREPLLQGVEVSIEEEDPERAEFEEQVNLDEEVLEQITDGAQLAIVNATADIDGETDEERWALATEDGEWRLVEHVTEPAEETGEDSTEEVADSVNVINKVGRVDDGNAIDVLRLTVQREPESDETDLTERSVQYVGDNGFDQLVHGSQDIDGGAYYLDVLTAEDESDGVLTDDDDRYDIVIPFDTAASDLDLASDDPVGGENVDNEIERLEPSGQAELEITTAEGANRLVTIAAPETLDSASADETVEL